ncbi:hypothetical protein ACW9HW_01890 [Pseudomonas sp. SDO5532_S415]
MNQPFEVTVDGQVRIVDAVIIDNAQAVLNYLQCQISQTKLSPLVVLPLSLR